MNNFPVLSADHIDSRTPMGGNLLASGEGATFRVWAPAAREVRLLWGYRKTEAGEWLNDKEAVLQEAGDGFWAGFVQGLGAGERYMFWVVGPAEGGTEGLKRDPFARDLTYDPMWPDCHCILVDPDTFPWHDEDFRPPPFHELVIYQFHIGVWYIPEGRNNGTFLDVAGKLPYLKSLGINAIQPLPIVEFPTIFSLGYNGVDYFSPETDYGINDDSLLPLYLTSINQALLALDPGLTPYRVEDIASTVNQFKVMIDMCHLYDIAVLLDVVYNHAGGDFGDRSIYFLDRKPYGNQNDSLYFTDRGWAGGLVFAYWNDGVKQFLIDNALFYLTEYHCDGFRYDEVSVIKNEGGEHGWLFCRDVTDTCHYIKPEAIHIAECWPVEEAIVRPTDEGGAGFDATQNDGFREAVRSALGQASLGAGAFVDMDRVARELASPRLKDSWRAVQCTENHDIVRKDRAARVPRIADGSDARSWYARSRSRVALGLTLTAPGIPHIFMGQEFLEDKQWHDEPNSAFQIWWEGLDQGAREMMDFLRFTREVLAVRSRLKGLRGSGINVFHVNNENRVLAFHRWVPWEGHDVVVVASLNDSAWFDYNLGFPAGGFWKEEINSDVYDNWVNPWASGNNGGIEATGNGMHGLSFSARITIPANSILIFSRS